MTPGLMAATSGDMQKAGQSTYSYYRSDYDRESPFFIPPSVRHRWRVQQPSRFEVGSPLPQEGFQAAGSEAVGAEALAQQHTLQGMPRDYFPGPIDPPVYKASKAQGAYAGN